MSKTSRNDLTLSPYVSTEIGARSSSELFPSLSSWTSSRVPARVRRELQHSEHLAQLAVTALENATMLSTLEMYCSSIAPTGVDRYEHIVNTYVRNIANRIERW